MQRFGRIFTMLIDRHGTLDSFSSLLTSRSTLLSWRGLGIPLLFYYTIRSFVLFCELL